MRIAPGLIIGRNFEIGAFIGEGATGEVYQAWDRKTSTHVALKLLRAEYSADDDLKARFEREALVASKIESRHVARVIDAGDSGKLHRLWIAFELLQGETLDARLHRDAAIAPATTIACVEDLLRGLSDAHAADVIHRDIKPSNLFLDGRDGRLMILDFGVAKIVATAGVSSSGITRFGDALGTPVYASPEQLQSARDVDHRSDLYSAGTVAFRLLAGRLPYEQPDLQRLIAAKTVSDAPSLARATGAVWPPSMESWIGKMIARRAEDRYASASEGLVAWRAACDDWKNGGFGRRESEHVGDVDTDLTPPPSK